jgi:hypothetical protein
MNASAVILAEATATGAGVAARAAGAVDIGPMNSPGREFGLAVSILWKNKKLSQWRDNVRQRS